MHASGLVVNTIVFAESTAAALKILQTQFGSGNVVSISVQLR